VGARGSTHSPSRAGRLGPNLLFLGVICGSLANGVMRVESSGAVPAAEFPPAIPAYAAAPWVLIISVILAVVGAVTWWRGRGAATTGPAPANDSLTLTPLAALRAAAALWAGAGVAAWALALIESFIFTARFVPRLVPETTLLAYRTGLGGLAFAIGAWVAIVGTVYLAIIFICTIGAGRRGSDPRRGFAAGFGAALALTVLGLTQMTLWSEITQLGLWVPVGLCTLAISLWAARSTLSRLRRPTSDPGADLADTVVAMIGRLIAPTARRPELWCVLCSIIASVVLVLALYPDVEDFRMQLFPSFAMGAILLLTTTLMVTWRRLVPRRASAVVIFLTLAAGASTLALGGRNSEVHFVAHEYARFGQLLADIPTARWLHRFPEVGLTDNGHPAWPHHASGTERFGPVPTGVSAASGRPPVIFVVWDAARPDHLSLHGHHRPTSPHLEKLARRSVVFETARASATATTVGVKGLLSGNYSTRYMLATDHAPFLTSELADLGYDHFVITVTGNDHNGVSADAFRRGWSQAGRRLTFEDLEFPNHDHIKPDAEKTDAVIAALRRRAATHPGLEGTFAYVHLTGPHVPWTQAGIETPYGDTPADRYDAEITRCDRLLGRLTDALEDLGVLEKAFILVTADHGTALGEHGKIAGFLLYEEQVRIPLVMRLPGVPPRRVADPVASIDVVPTLLHLLDPDAPDKPHGFHGRSLLPLLAGGTLPPRPFVSFCAFWDSYAVYDPEHRWKLHHHRGRRYEALFDLNADPAERRNLISEHPDVAADLRTSLDGFLWEGRASYGNPYHYRSWSGPGN